MTKFLTWGATFSVNMLCRGKSGILSIPIHSYIDNTQSITIEKTTIDKYNNMHIAFSYKPTETKSINDVVNGACGYRENYNERYDEPERR
jgi:hypothetical protein